MIKKIFCHLLPLLLLSILLSACGGGDWPEKGHCEDPNFVGPCKPSGPDIPTPSNPPASKAR
jgi:hypothetical protein